MLFYTVKLNFYKLFPLYLTHKALSTMVLIEITVTVNGAVPLIY